MDDINNISWDEYFIGLCKLSALRSKDPSTKVGACIVDNNNHIIGMGYNGFPKGCDDSKLPWCKNNKSWLDNKYAYVVHAEVNAILNSNPIINKSNTRLYITLFPCNECVKLIIQSDIKEIIYVNDNNINTESGIAARKMLDLANIKYTQYIEQNKTIKLNI